MSRPLEKTLCHACGADLSDADPGWECNCGIAVCTEPDCFEECFKLVAAGEGTRCLSCGEVL
jgi:hypothetical protein